jgi:hypothetical protein
MKVNKEKWETGEKIRRQKENITFLVQNRFGNSFRKEQDAKRIKRLKKKGR